MKKIKPMPEIQRGKIFQIRDKPDGSQWVRYWGAEPDSGSLCEKSAPVALYLQEFPGHPIRVWKPFENEASANPKAECLQMTEYEPNVLGTLFKSTPLRYYTGICRGGVCSTELTTEECAVILKTHDYGIWSLDEEEVILLNGVIQKLKDVIHP